MKKFIQDLKLIFKEYFYTRQGLVDDVKRLTEETNRWQKQHASSSAEIRHLKNTQTAINNVDSLYGNTVVLLSQALIEYYKPQDASTLRDWPFISIIMPVWDREKFVATAIDSVIAQTYPHWELLIIDDGSTDQTAKVIEPYLKDPRIHYIFQPHSGGCVARNKGLAASKGAVIAYLDSDNWWYSHTLLIAAHHFLQYPQDEAIRFASFCEESTQNRKWIWFNEKLTYEDDVIKKISEHMVSLDISSFIHRRYLYEQYGGFDENLTRLVDYDLTGRYQLHVEIVPLSFVGTYYNYGLADNTITARQSHWDNFYKIRAKYPNELAEQYETEK